MTCWARTQIWKWENLFKGSISKVWLKFKPNLQKKLLNIWKEENWTEWLQKQTKTNNRLDLTQCLGSTLRFERLSMGLKSFDPQCSIWSIWQEVRLWVKLRRMESGLERAQISIRVFLHYRRLFIDWAKTIKGTFSSTTEIRNSQEYSNQLSEETHKQVSFALFPSFTLITLKPWTQFSLDKKQKQSKLPST